MILQTLALLFALVVGVVVLWCAASGVCYLMQLEQHEVDEDQSLPRMWDVEREMWQRVRGWFK